GGGDLDVGHPRREIAVALVVRDDALAVGGHGRLVVLRVVLDEEAARRARAQPGEDVALGDRGVPLQVHADDLHVALRRGAAAAGHQREQCADPLTWAHGPGWTERNTRRYGARHRLLQGGSLFVRTDPYAALVHERDLLLDHLAPVLGVLHRRPVQVEVLGIDRPVVDELILFD